MTLVADAVAYAKKKASAIMESGNAPQPCEHLEHASATGLLYSPIRNML